MFNTVEKNIFYAIFLSYENDKVVVS